VQDWEDLARQARFAPAIMADLCLISLRQLERYFSRQFRKTPRAWTRELRCRLAIRLVSQGWSTKAIAYELKYASESHFCHEFKKALGSTPQTFAPIYGSSPLSFPKSNPPANQSILPGQQTAA
jgi:AraC-like DNA-binding protein